MTQKVNNFSTNGDLGWSALLQNFTKHNLDSIISNFFLSFFRKVFKKPPNCTPKIQIAKNR
jgi:hypothetical protein